MRWLALILLLMPLGSTASADPESGFRIVADRVIVPEVARIVVTRAGSPAPGEPKHVPLAVQADSKKPIAVEAGATVDVWLIPKVGVPLRFADGIRVEAGKVRELRPGDAFGILTIRGENLPRLGRIVVTAEDDPGPDEKGHRRLQFADDYKTDIVVPAGTVRIWIVPHNGARATKIDDAVRILAGRSVVLD